MSEFADRWQNRRQPLDFSGVWRFRELLPFADEDRIVTIGEGQTLLRPSPPVARFVGLDERGLFLHYEGLNPSGSFKDNGMTAAATHAHMVGARIAACASTGNTSASLALYAGASGLFRAVVFVGSGKISLGKLSQALDFSATTIQIDGDFDDALRLVREVCQRENVYLCNSLNPFRIEGQKTTAFRILESLDWQIPDWIVVPGGNLGNSSALGKAFLELKTLGLCDRVPRLAIINAQGANTLYELHEDENIVWNGGRPDRAGISEYFARLDRENRRAATVATAIQINRPVNLEKALRALDVCDGVVRQLSDQEILDAKAQVGAGGFGCEPASAASVAGARLLVQEGVISRGDRVVCILTGHQLKDPDATVAYHSPGSEASEQMRAAHGIQQAPHANPPQIVANNLEEIVDVLRNVG
jgi:threonine synthase